MERPSVGQIRGWLRLLEEMRAAAHAQSDEDFCTEVLWAVPETDAKKISEQDAAYEAALDRAFTAIPRLCQQAKKGRERRERVIEQYRKFEAGLPNSLVRYFNSRTLAEAGLVLAFEARYRDAKVMRKYAWSAWVDARETPPENSHPGLIFDLRARTLAELANAWRVNDDFDEAERCLAVAGTWLVQGTGDAGLFARVLAIEANLRADQRRFDRALSLLEQAYQLYLEIGERHLAGRTLVSRGRVVYAAGDPAESVLLIEKGMDLLDRERDPRLIRTTYQSLLVGLVDCGEHRRAGELLLESGLREAFAEEPLNLLRLRWVEAKIHRGMDRLDRAESAFQEVRAGFLERTMPYDAALAGLDLAVVWFRQGKIGQLVPLMKEMFDVCERFKLPLAAQESFLLLDFLCKLGFASLERIERTQSFLVRLQAEPGLKLDMESIVFG